MKLTKTNNNVLSLFNGLSCGHLALDKIGMKVDKYYSSEIDKHAIQVCQYNYPETVQLGDVTKWREWDIEWEKIDLVLAGSPCQGFSFAGKQLAFDDPRSKLFFVFVEILEYIKSVNPKVKWLLENVRMKKEHEYVISKTVGIEPVIINSALLSAQNRVRLYWTNFYTKKKGLFETEYCAIPQPKDLGIMLKDVLDAEVDEKYYLKDKAILRSLGIGNSRSRLTDINEEEKSGSILANQSKQSTDMVSLKIPEATKKGFTEIAPGECFDAEHLSSSPSGGRKMENKSNTLMAKETDFMQYTPDFRIRRLTPIECARLQTIPDGYFINKETGKYIVSETQVYRQCGNGWTVDVIAYLLSFMNK